MSPPVVRVMRVLDYLAFHPDEEFTISELARRLALNKATCHAIVTALLERRYLTKNETSGRFQLGPALIPLSHVAQRRFRVLDLATSELQALAVEFGVTVVASISTEAEILHLARFGPESIFNAMARPGMRLPLTPPLGTTFYAWSTQAEIEAWLAKLQEPHPDLDHYRVALERARKLGFVAGRNVPAWGALNEAIRATDADPEVSRPILEQRIEAVEPGTYLLDLTTLDDQPTFIAAPVFDSNGRIVLAITALLGTGGSVDVAALAPRLVELTTHMTLASGGVLPR